jgi:hypothetical protein
MLTESRDVIKDDYGRKLLSGRPFPPDVRPRPRLPRGWVFTVHGRGKNRVRTDARKNKIQIQIQIFFGSCCRLGKFTIFGFWFSIPKIPKLPGRNREKKKVFSA